MMKKLPLIFFWLFPPTVLSQTCPDLLNPVNGETNVPVDTEIVWAEVEGIPGYQIRLGTAPGQADIAQASVGSATSYTPPLGLPENTQIYVTIILDFLFEGGVDIVCDSQSFTTENVTQAPSCTTMNVPADGAEGVSVFTNVTWQYAPRATGYYLSLGTAPGIADLLNNGDIGNVLNYNPPFEFPPQTTIYVTLTPYNENGSAIGCTDFSFTTAEVAPLPGCTTLISPLNGEGNIPLTPFLEWTAVPGATGYRVTIGDTPGGSNVLDNAVFFTNSTFIIDFEPNKTFFITIIPFNDSGDAIGCSEEFFSTIIGCGPFYDPSVDDFVDFSPDLTLLETYSFCQNSTPFTLTAPEGADGYRWFKVNEFGVDPLLSEDANVLITEDGAYYLEAYNLTPSGGGLIECPTILTFNVVSSEPPVIENIIIEQTISGLDLTVIVLGDGDYEYAIDNSDGPYQESNVFLGVPPGTRTLYVRDKSGCGMAQETIRQDITVEGFPKFFTPNGDSINDVWQYITPPNADQVLLNQVMIFDRYGKLLKAIYGNVAWDGTFLGRPAPAGEYWFEAVDSNNIRYKGHFSLKR